VESRLADPLKEHLTRDFTGLVDVFVSSDRTSITAGSKWLEEVTDAINRSSLVVVLCSNESVSRPWINFEAGAAHVRGKPIVPFCHTDLTPAQLPVPLSESEGVQGSKPEGIRKLYEVVSQMLGSQVPDVNFDSYAEEVQKFEAEYRNERSTLIECTGIEQTSETVSNPRVLCISSPQFLEIGYQNQLEVVLSAFPDDLAHLRVDNAKDLQLQLTTSGFDIVHIAAFVCPRSGDMYFSSVDLNTGERTTSEVEIVGAKALALLLKMAKTRLAVITSCDSLALAATLLGVTNVVATRDMVSPKMMAAWVEGSYGMLKKRPLSESFEYAMGFSRAPMCLYRRRGDGDIVFTVEEERKRALSH
jgi:hypothetical protein